MLLDPETLKHDLDRLEEIEKATLRLVTQAIYDYRETALEIFHQEGDLAADISEDITREALDRLGMPRIDQRLFGKVDYKRACYVFHPDYALKQALFVDSKAEKVGGQGTATLQLSQLSMAVKQTRSGQTVNIQGKMPTVITLRGEKYLTTTLFVKYNYDKEGGVHILKSIIVAAVPNGMLQDRYNPIPEDTIWTAGRNAPSLGEEFRVRLSFSRLKHKAAWRVQTIPMPPEPFYWSS
ncbi:SfiI family type II restriction endonuclease [Chloroflexus aggregans]|uniref:Type II restriction enzyme, SfiI family n=1 Tax=Chloroflexus aggregans (strain MD-66 / DSM 9485) TaxID=326427 RepID=B8G8D0_CHLAD|nr:SfiI family type II restriction endonuclease [Chloroflexus aggregans]ACL26184.1 type II restriction enzyme, SfiI family [Chloroflexus aggregans DSM 9485]